MIVGHHAPPPDSASGVAHYAQRLEQLLLPHCQLTAGGHGARKHLYHIGNNSLHRDIYARALAHPSIVLLHDATLHHFYLGAGDARRYEDEFAWQYGEWRRGEAQTLWARRAGSAADPDYFRLAMLGRIAKTARHLIVHNRAALAKVREQAPEAPATVIPHFVEPRTPATREAIAQTRARLNVGPGDFLLGVFGHLRESKRVLHVLRAFAAAYARNRRLRLLVAGACASEPYRRALEPWLGSDGVIGRPHLPGDSLWIHLSACQACVNLRYPSAGESSGISALAMAAGTPLLLTAESPADDLPESAYLAIPSGPAEHAALTTAFLTLADSPRLTRNLGAELRDFALSRRTPAHLAPRFLNVLENTDFT